MYNISCTTIQNWNMNAIFVSSVNYDYLTRKHARAHTLTTDDHRYTSYIFISLLAVLLFLTAVECVHLAPSTVCSWLLSVQSAATPNVCLTLTQNFWCWWTPRSPKTEYGNTTHMVWYFYVMAVKPDRYGLEHCIKDTYISLINVIFIKSKFIFNTFFTKD